MVINIQNLLNIFLNFTTPCSTTRKHFIFKSFVILYVNILSLYFFSFSAIESTKMYSEASKLFFTNKLNILLQKEDKFILQCKTLFRQLKKFSVYSLRNTT